MTKRYRITQKAKSDLYSIAQYSARAWGNKQKNLYISKLKKRIEWLSKNPKVGKNRAEIQSDVYSYPEGEHVIFFTIDDAYIEIIGILHNRMDVASNLH